jgi:hypothetical protein
MLYMTRGRVPVNVISPELWALAELNRSAGAVRRHQKTIKQDIFFLEVISST